MNKIHLLVFFLFGSVYAYSQGLENHLPTYAQYVITLNAQSYSGKADMNEVSKMDFFKAMNKEGKTHESIAQMISHILGQPASCGVQLLPRAYVFRIDHDSVSGWAYLFSLKDQKEFSKFLKESLHEEGKPEPEVFQNNGYSNAASGLMTAAWTSDFALLLVRDAYNRYSYADTYYDAEATARANAAADSIQATIAAREMYLADSIAAAEAEAAQKQKGKNKKSPAKNGKLSAEEKRQEALEAAKADSLAAVAIALLAEKENANYNASGGDNYEAANRERELQADKKMNARCERKLKEMMNLPPNKSMLRIRSFTESQKEPFDIAVFMNFSGNSFPNLDPFSRKMNSRMTHSADSASALSALAKDNYSVAYCNFEKGKINVQHTVFVNPEMDNLIGGLYKKKGDKNFVKYIKGTNLMGYGSMSVNVEKTLKATREILIKTYEETMGENAKFITGMMDITGVFTNDDVVNNLFKGDFALAVTDLRPYKTTFTSYKYDDNFARTETKEEKTEVLPEFVAMASVGKPDEMKKILKAVEKMGGIKEEGAGVYLIKFPGHADYRIYLALENNILFCTNNDELIHGKLKTGYSKSEQMTSDQKNLLCNSAVAYYWNGTKTFELAAKQPDWNKSEKFNRVLGVFKDNVKEARLTGVIKKNNTYVTNMSLDLTDTSVNSLFSLFKMMNSFSLIDK
jgi:hypothetical protein